MWAKIEDIYISCWPATGWIIGVKPIQIERIKMPHWNEELQQWGFHYYEDYQPGEWLGIDRRIKMPIDQEELQRRATYHPPSDKAQGLHIANREQYLRYADFIAHNIPDCREASVAQTNLEQVMFWVDAAIARNHEKL